MKAMILDALRSFYRNLGNSKNRAPSPGRSFIILGVLACFAFLPGAQGQLSPPPDRCYPNFTTAEGCNALNSLTTGSGNTGLGWWALFTDTDGSFNTGVGAGALILNNGSSNTAVGTVALLLNTTGAENTAVGTDALLNNDSDGAGLGNGNTAVGFGALFNNVDGSDNTAVGDSAGQNVITGFNNTYIGDFVGFLAGDESNTIRIGDLSNGNGAGSLECFIGGIWNNPQPRGGSVVVVTLDLADDHLGWDVVVSPDEGGSAPVPRSAPQSHARRAMPNGKVGKVEKLEATVAQQQKQIETLTAQLKQQAAQIQKVSAQLELNNSAMRTVARDR
jgi:hypothetical protein